MGVGPHSQLLHSQKVEEREEGMRRPPKPPAKDPPKLLPDPFPVAEFGSHVERNHTNNNQPFATEFEVQILHKMHTSTIWCTIIMVLCVMQALGDGQGKSVTVARSVENRKKNRFANISACESFTINKSHPVCVMVCR